MVRHRIRPGMEVRSMRSDLGTATKSGLFPNANSQGTTRAERARLSGKEGRKDGQSLAEGEWWEIEPDVGRVVDGFSRKSGPT